MSIYDRFRNVAKNSLEKFGAVGSIVRNKTTNYPCHYLIQEYDPRERDGQLIQFTDRKVMVAALALGIVPSAETDQLQADELLRIVTVRKIAPGGIDIYYELQVRR